VNDANAFATQLLDCIVAQRENKEAIEKIISSLEKPAQRARRKPVKR